MPVWGWVLIGVGAVLLLALAAWTLVNRRRSMKLRERFGPEYERALDQSSSTREAETELAERQRRREQLHIRPLGRDARDHYADRWQQVQADFVDSPATAVTEADALVTEVMSERGYPMDDFEQRSADVSVDHPEVVESYREGHRLSRLSARGEASTEDLRQALQHYRRLFDELLERSADEPIERERADLESREEIRAGDEQPTERTTS
jgi:hypothetical protein